MYKITIVVPNDELQTPDEFGDLRSLATEGTTTVIITAREDDDALRLIIDFCKKIASGRAKSLTITKEDSDDNKTDC